MVDKVRAKAIERHAVEIDENFRKAIQQIQEGKSIHQVLADAKVPRAEMHKFFANQYAQWKVQIIQDSEAYSGQASIPEPRMGDFPSQNPNNSFQPGDGEVLLEGLLAKAMGIKTEGVEGEEYLLEAFEGLEEPEAVPEGPMSEEEIEAMARETLGEWESFSSEMWNTILDAQLVKDYEAKMAEIQQEVQRIIQLAKEGKIGPEFVLIALAKVNVAKNGVIFSWLGKKSFAINEDMNRASEALQGMDTSDPGYYAALEGMQADTREGSFSLNMITGDMQKVAQNVSNTLETVHGMMEEINRSRREIIARVAAAG